jgi:hypothetical protein
VELRERVAQSEVDVVPVLVRAEEVPFDERAQLPGSGRRAHLEVEAAGVGGELRAAPDAGGLVSGLDRNGIRDEAVVGAQIVEREDGRRSNATAKLDRGIGSRDANRTGEIACRGNVRLQLGDFLAALLDPPQAIFQRFLSLQPRYLLLDLLESGDQRVELRLKGGHLLPVLFERSSLHGLFLQLCFESRLQVGDLGHLQFEQGLLFFDLLAELRDRRLRRGLGLLRGGGLRIGRGLGLRDDGVHEREGARERNEARDESPQTRPPERAGAYHGESGGIWVGDRRNGCRSPLFG